VSFALHLGNGSLLSRKLVGNVRATLATLAKSGRKKCLRVVLSLGLRKM